MVNVARMEHHRTVMTRRYPVDVILREIQTGKTTVIESDPVAELAGGRSLRHATEFARRLLSEGKKDGYDVVKKSLPAFTPAGYSSDGSRDIDTLTGCVCLEWDDLDDPAWAFSELAQSPLTLAVWYSFSGCPKALFRVDPLPSHESFEEAWYAAAVEFEELGDPDLTSSRHSQAQALVFSPELHYNPNAQVITYDPVTRYFQEAFPNARADADFAALDKLPSEYQALIVDLEFDGDGHCKTRVPCPSTHHENDSFENLRANATKVSRREDGSLHFHCFKCGRTKIFGTRHNRVVRLTETDILSDVTRENLEDMQDFVRQSLNTDLSGQVFAMRFDTGTGKTEQAILIIGARPILLVGSHDLGKEIYDRAIEVNRQSFLYRGLMHKADGGEFPHESPCIQPYVLDELRKKGANAFEHGCKGCGFIELCKQSGMHSQHERLLDPNNLIILAIPQLFIDPVFRSFLDNRLKLTYEDIVLVDDASTEGLFLDESIALEFLIEKIKVWKGSALGVFAKAVKDIVTENDGVDLVKKLQSLIEDTLKNVARRKTLYEQLRKVRYYDSHTKRYVQLNIDDAIKSGFCEIKTAEDRAKLQTAERKGWTTLDRLRIFFKAYPNPERAPMRFDKTTGILHFSVPGQLYSTEAAIGFMGATLDLDIVRSVFQNGTRYIKELRVFDAASTEWHSESKAYQLRNNRNPRATLLKYQGGGELSNTGLEFFGYFKSFVKANPDKKHALITYKSVIEHYKSEIDALGVAYSWFHNTEGLDKRFEGCEVFHVLGLPARSPIDIEWTAKTWGISEDEVSERLVSQELQQAYGRARLVRYPNTVIAYTSHKTPHFTDRCELSDELDWQTAGFDLERLPEVIAVRREREQLEKVSVDAAIQSGDVQAYAEATGKSERTAYRKTAATRPQCKAEQDDDRDADILRILQSDPKTSLREIERQLKADGHKRTDRKYIKKIVAKIRGEKRKKT